MRVALYARTSTRDKGQDPELQLEDLRRLAGQRGWTVAQTYVDHGVSGVKASRPALDRLMADARAGKFKVVAVWRFDRFARSTQHQQEARHYTQTAQQEQSSPPGHPPVSSPVGAGVRVDR